MCEVENETTLKAYFEENYATLRSMVSHNIFERNPAIREEQIDEVLNQTYIEVHKRKKNQPNIPYSQHAVYAIQDAIEEALYLKEVKKLRAAIKQFKKTIAFQNLVKDLIKDGMIKDEAEERVILEWFLTKNKQKYILLTIVDIGKLARKPNEESGYGEFNNNWFDLPQNKYKSSTEVENQKLIDAVNYCSDKYKDDPKSKNSKRDYKVYVDFYFNNVMNRTIAENLNIKPARVTQICRMVRKAIVECIFDVLIGQGHYELL